MKNKFLYWIFFIILLIISFLLYRSTFMNLDFIPDRLETSAIYALAVIFAYLLVVIPLVAYLSEKLVEFCIKQKPLIRRSLITSIIVIPILVYSLLLYNEYKEKPFDEVIAYGDSFERLGFHPGKGGYGLITNQIEDADEFADFLEQYRVKKVRDKEWNAEWSQEKGIIFTIYTDDLPIMATIFENRVSINAEPYEVVNGPIDIDWIEKFAENLQ